VNFANGATRNYRLRADGVLSFSEANRLGRLTEHGPDLLFDVANNAECLHVKQVLQVEHFNPAQAYLAGGKPATVGTGGRTKWSPR
jgi:hypothetical protein